MHSERLAASVRRLSASGTTDAKIGETLGLPRTTVRDLRRRRPRAVCPRCSEPSSLTAPSAAAYAELLGYYLGDGHIVRVGRSFRLRLSMDSRYPGLIGGVQDLLARVFAANVVGLAVRDGGACTVVSVNHRHLPCLLPQHAPGSRKHERRLVFEPWQLDALDRAPWEFLRGCFMSDGCAFVNRTGPYEYLCYDFSNRSADILDLVSTVLSRVGVEHRRYARSIRVYRRGAVALMEARVGAKS